MTANTWDYTLIRTKGRFVEFPIWKFCTPGEVAENYPQNRVQALLRSFADHAEYLEATYGAAPLEWLENLKLKLLTVDAPVGDEALPF